MASGARHTHTQPPVRSSPTGLRTCATSTPARSTRYWATSSLHCHVASCRGETDWRSRASGSTCLVSTRYLTVSRWPLRAAQCSGRRCFSPRRPVRAATKPLLSASQPAASQSHLSASSSVGKRENRRRARQWAVGWISGAETDVKGPRGATGLGSWYRTAARGRPMHSLAPVPIQPLQLVGRKSAQSVDVAGGGQLARRRGRHCNGAMQCKWCTGFRSVREMFRAGVLARRAPKAPVNKTRPPTTTPNQRCAPLGSLAPMRAGVGRGIARAAVCERAPFRTPRRCRARPRLRRCAAYQNWRSNSLLRTLRCACLRRRVCRCRATPCRCKSCG